MDDSYLRLRRRGYESIPGDNRGDYADGVSDQNKEAKVIATKDSNDDSIVNQSREDYIDPIILNLKLAIENSNISLVDRIIRENPYIVNKTSSCFSKAASTSDLTALYYAIRQKNLEAVTTIIDSAGVTIDKNNQIEAIAVAVQYENIDILKKVLTTYPAHINTRCDSMLPLHIAVKKGNMEAVKVLLNFGADINAFTRCGKGKGIWGGTALSYAIGELDVDTVKLFLERGANVDICATYVDQQDEVRTRTPSQLLTSKKFIFKDVGSKEKAQELKIEILALLEKYGAQVDLNDIVAIQNS